MDGRKVVLTKAKLTPYQFTLDLGGTSQIKVTLVWDDEARFPRERRRQL